MTIKTVTVLGGAGFVGAALVTKLDAAGYQIKVVTRNRERAKQLILLPNVKVVSCDYGNGQALNKLLMGSDAVINLAGILHESKRSNFQAVHHQLPRRLAQLCVELNIPRVLHMSALGAGLHASSLYLRSKAQGETAINEFNKKLDITIFKPSVIFGRDDQFINLFAGLIKLLPIVVLAKPVAKFQPIWVEDVATAFLHSIENPLTYGKTYELGGPQIYTLHELVKKVMNILDKQRPILGLGDRLSYLQAAVMEWLPVKLITRDNVRSMESDNILASPVSPDLSLTLTPLEAVVPEYLINDTPRAAYNAFRSAAGRAINARR